MIDQTKYVVFMVALAGSPMLVSAQEPQGDGMQWGPFRALPRIDLEYMHTDNLYNADTREKSSNIFVVNPGLRLDAGTATMRYVLDADIEAGEVSQDSDDDYVDLALTGQAVYQPNSRLKLDLFAGFKKDHDPRGTGRQDGGTSAAKEPDEYDQTDLGAEFIYGVADAKGQIILNLDYMDKEYTNNRLRTVNAATSGTRLFDRDEFGQSAAFKWRVGPKTTVLFEARNRDFDYDFTLPGTAKLDSDEQHYFVGVEWQATYKTTGALRVGHMRKDFDSSVRNDESGGSWEASITWRPRSYSAVNVTTGRTYGETNGTGDASLSDYFGVSWDHQWMERLSTSVSYDYSDTEYPGSQTATTREREDDLDTFAFEANYEARRWLTLGAGFEHIDNDSNNNGFDYDRNNVFVNARMQF